MAWSVGRPSRRKNEPGIFPAAYARSSMSTVRGKKSIPSRTCGAALAVTNTTVSPTRATTAPWDCGASLPVSNDSVLSVPEIGPDTEMASAMCTPLQSGGEPVVSCRTPPPLGPGIRRLAAGSAALSWIRVSAAQGGAGGQRPITLHVVVADVVEQPATTADEHQESPPTVVVLLVDLQVVGELVDALRQQRHLHLRRPGVGVVDLVFGDRRGFVRHAERSLRSGRECAPAKAEAPNDRSSSVRPCRLSCAFRGRAASLSMSSSGASPPRAVPGASMPTRRTPGPRCVSTSPTLPRWDRARRLGSSNGWA